MADPIRLYTDPAAMEPLFPDDPSGELEALAVELIARSAALAEAMHPVTRAAVADLVRPMNSYYSNLIEGHDTHPLDIDRALRNDYATDKRKRDLQKEALAHIAVSKALRDGELRRTSGADPSSEAFIKGVHRAFYEHLPEDFLRVVSKEGVEKTVIPGEYRTGEVEVGRHIAPAHAQVPRFMAHFASYYDREAAPNRSRVRRVIAMAAAHHRLVWIHPFLDGNGRVVRLCSDAWAMSDGLDAAGLWSISRGLARKRDEYRTMLEGADAPRMGDLDGRGNLSNAQLVAFCRWFLVTAIDQVSFMRDSFQLDGVLRRIDVFVDRMASEGRMRGEARHLLKDAFLRGRVSRQDAERITDTTDKTLKKITDELIALGLLKRVEAGGGVLYEIAVPIMFSPWILPGLFPTGRESEIMAG
ncbi:MAG: Fic family protein [Flavobacteriales bacterium]|nr:Fic family protein [Flavobacteriales bacterium]